MKNFLSAVSAAIMLALFVTSCGGDSAGNSSISDPVSSAEELVSSAPAYAENPLTGVANLTPGAENRRMAAVMINNLKAAWSVQTGLTDADIVVETLAEGGVTRLMAVYQDVAKAKQIGPIRSARLSFGELARGFDAVYFSFGLDKTYFSPQISSIGVTHSDLMKAESYTTRIKNGKATEHTLYSSGELLAKYLDSKIDRKTTNFNGNFCDFAEEDEAINLTGGDALSVRYSMSNNIYVNSFGYDAEKELYLKSQGDAPHTDWKSGEQISVKNVFLLYSKIETLADNVHVKTQLQSGSGYYFSEGKYCEISWSKGNSSDKFTFKNTDGTSLKVNPGNSWISIPDSAQASTLVIN